MDSLDSYDHLDLPADDPPDRDIDRSNPDNTSLLQSSKKRKKVQLKRVVCVPITGDASRDISKGLTPPTDFWAWRKYGQKPIKGSPYPRGYYRCSSSKGCSARKQVERSRRDPSMLIVTYTADHNHSNTGKAAAVPASSSKDHDINAVEPTLVPADINNIDEDDVLNLSSSAQAHFNQNIVDDGGDAHSHDNMELSTFHSPTRSNSFPCLLSSSHSSNGHQEFSLELVDQQQQVVQASSYNWGGPHVKEECIAGEWQEDEYYYIIDEKKDNMSLCLSRCEEDDFFSELGMLPELASIFNNSRVENSNSVGGGPGRGVAADDVRSIGLDHEHAAIFGSTTGWSNPPCPLA
ncbi:hypothetical protein GOP47_0025853 [Adiantum capillus-veneris]|uniref:WRKY domain-containing protein n=1 Tax=Adiantum capillus-veneris TaxID=13818 RepID=A0A9D4U314_ADICA|nr:hypothetical protein GOP47_0025853 [Adiantum capillus-veneris]